MVCFVIALEYQPVTMSFVLFSFWPYRGYYTDQNLICQMVVQVYFHYQCLTIRVQSARIVYSQALKLDAENVIATDVIVRWITAALPFVCRWPIQCAHAPWAIQNPVFSAEPA